MIDLYYWTTPNGHKITMFLEEAKLKYQLRPINIGKGEQFDPEFLKIAPNNRIPAIVDHAPIDSPATGRASPISVFESGAILLYLAGKTGKFIPKDLRGQVACTEWLFWQMGGLGPMCGQNHHFNIYAPEKIPYAIDRYVRETARLYGVLDRHLAGRDFICGQVYTIADMACYPWIVPHQRQQQDLDHFPNLKRWFTAIAARPGTQRAYARAEAVTQGPAKPLTDEERKVLFGQQASGKP
jgi:GSH-dependent disulfide-bond oxidoreductase